MFKKILATVCVCSLALASMSCAGSSSTTAAATTAAATTAAATTEAATTTEAEVDDVTEDESVDDSEIEIVGGYEDQASEEAVFDEETEAIWTNGVAGSAFEDAKPIALLATQVVSGTNYLFLAERDTEEYPYQLIVIYQDLEGNVSAISASGIDYTADGWSNGESIEVLDGGWTVVENTYANPAKSNIEVFDAAMEGLTGVSYELIAILGYQVVSGTNYRVICKATTVTPDAVPGLAMVTLYKPLDGDMEVSEIEDIDLNYLLGE